MGFRSPAMCVRILSSLLSFIVVQERREREGESQTLVFIWAAGATRLGQTPSVWVTRVLSK